MRLTDRSIIILAGILLSAPLFFIGLVGHDSVTHLILSREFTNQFLSGDLAPRWLFRPEEGFGTAALYTLPSIHYYLITLLYPLNFLDGAFNFASGQTALLTSASLAVTVSGLMAYRFFLLYTSRDKALLAAIIYMILPHHMHDMYIRFALSQLWAYALIPLCAYYIKKPNFILLSIFTGLLTVTHLITAIFTLPFLALYAITEKKTKLIIALPISLSLACFYLVPFFSIIQFMRPDIGVGIYSIANNFLDLGGRMNNYLLAGLIPLAILFSFNLKQFKSKNFVWPLATIGCLFMTISISNFIWELIPPLSILSFPWRFLTLAVFTSAFLSIYTDKRISLFLIAICGLIMIPLFHIQNEESAQKYLQHNVITVDAFRTKWTPQELVVKDGFKTGEFLSQYKFPDADLQFSKEKILVTPHKTGLITIQQFYFPNFKSEYELSPQDGTGFMQVNVLKEERFIIESTTFKAEKTGLIISLLSCLLLSFMFLYTKYSKRNKQ